MRVKSLKELGKGGWTISPKYAGELEQAKKSKGAKGSPPHDLLWNSISTRRHDAVREYANAVPGRKYRLDIAIPSVRLAIEVDGWEFHGKYLADFQRDRQRQNLLTLNGWRILRFTAGEIYKEMDRCIEQVLMACDVIRHEAQPPAP